MRGFDLIHRNSSNPPVDGGKRTSVSAAAAGRAPRCPAPLVLADGPGRRRGGRSGRGRMVLFHERVWIHATQLHDVEQPGEIVRTDPIAESERHWRFLSLGRRSVLL